MRLEELKIQIVQNFLDRFFSVDWYKLNDDKTKFVSSIIIEGVLIDDMIRNIKINGHKL